LSIARQFDTFIPLAQVLQRHRRTLLKLLSLAPLLLAGGASPVIANGRRRLKTSLNAFSFNDALLKGTMSLDDLLEFCSSTGFDAVDITGYYFEGYPMVPSDEEIFRIKRKAFGYGLEISGTGVRNDFTWLDPVKRKENIDLVMKWVEAAAKLDAPVLRVFAGTQKVATEKRPEIIDLMMKDLSACAEYGKRNGVIIGLQNHHDFFTTAGEVIQVVKAINSPWLGLIVDTGSFRIHDPYEEVALAAPYAVNWQIKEKLFIRGTEVEADIQKIISIVKSSGYSGYLPIETLGEGDPKPKVAALFYRVTQALNT
jgi:sugar phosphate isomerase/epimerase